MATLSQLALADNQNSKPNMVVTAENALGGELAPEVRAALDQVRDTRAGLYDTFESSILGQIATPAEMAATQRNWRDYYSPPATTLSTADRKALAAKVGRVTLFGRPRTEHAFPLGILGAHAIDVEGRPELTVTEVTPDTPAATGGLEIDDVIIGANGRVIPPWEDPRVPMGYAIAAAQTRAHGGKLTLHVGRAGKIIDVTIELPISEAYDEANPYDCARARKVAADAVEYVLKEGDDTFWMDLFLMACGDERAIALVRDRLRKAPTSETIDSNWGASYKLLSLCEYYLLTGDQMVLPAIRGHVRGLEKNQVPAGGWGHGAPGGYGLMNQVGQICFMGLVLAEECGIKVDPDVLARAVKLSGRFIGTYSAYGDHAPGVARYGKSAPFDNGIVPAHAVLFSLLGEHAVANSSARRSCYLYRTRMGGHAERIFAIAWSSVGASLAPEAEYSMYANNMLWFYELARQRDGSLKNLAYTRYGRNTAALGMTFAMANKRLRIAGSARGTKPLFPVASLPSAPPPPPPPDRVVHKKRTSKATPDKETWGVKEFPAIKPSLIAGEMPSVTFGFKTDPARYSDFCITLPAKIGGELWLNEHCVALFSKSTARGGEQTLTLGTKAIAAMRKGENTCILYSTDLTKPADFTIAMGPSAAGKAMPFHSPSYGNNRRNGWIGSAEQHRQAVAWAFEGQPARVIARYLAYPDWMGAQAAFQALARGGDEAIALAKQLVTDSHTGIRLGAWDTVAEMNTHNVLDAATQKEFAQLAASRIATEDPAVGQAMGRAASPMATGEGLAKLLVGIAKLEDPKAREMAVKAAKERLAKQPTLMVQVLRTVIDAKLNQSDIRALGSAMGGVSSVATNPAARDALREIAGVLDEVAPDTRGMFTDGLMHGGLPVIEHNLTPTTEKTPQLVSGLCKCFVKVPDTDWPGWAYANLYFRRLIYRLTPESVATLRATAAALKTEEQVSEDAQRLAVVGELQEWADLLARTDGDDDRLKKEALRLAKDADPVKRAVALSLVWPSQRALMLASTRYSNAKDVPDTSRIEDPATALAVATAAAEHLESNTPTHWFMIWLTVNKHQDQPGAEKAIPLCADYLDKVAFRKTGTFRFRAIHQATVLVENQIGKATETPALARGLAKTYATSSSMEWYKSTQGAMQKVLKKMGPKSKAGIGEAVPAMQAWLKNAPADEKKEILDRFCPPKQLQERFEELRELAGEN